MERICFNIEPIVKKIERTVSSHKIAQGNYARWIWSKEGKNRELGSNPYGVADAANILYTIGRFPSEDAEREAFVRVLRAFQDPKSGLFYESTHHTYHTTAHCTAALELFDKLPIYPFAELKQFDDPKALCEFLDSLEWVRSPWNYSHRGAGVFAAKIIAESPSLEWQNVYFDYLDSNCDKKYGMGRDGAIDDIEGGSRHIAHHLNGWFHYCFNYNHCRRPFPHIRHFIDTLIEMYESNNFESPSFGRMIGFREVDWVFCINRATCQSGYRRDEAKALIRDFAGGYIEFLNSVDADTHDSFNDLHMLFGTVCCLAELQLALPGEILTTRPLRSVLDRRPFI